MTGPLPYPHAKNQQRLTTITSRTVMVLLCMLLCIAAGYGQAGNSLEEPRILHNYTDTNFEFRELPDDYEEISITLHVPRIGSLEIPAIIFGQQVYLSVEELFNFLKIRNIVSDGYDSVTGFFINPKATYLIDKPSRKIIYQEKAFMLRANDLIRTSAALYLNAEYFGKVFGLECVFNFRSLAVTLNTQIELPAIREMQLELMRNNLRQLKGEKKADTIIQRSFPLFHVGMADWAVISNQETNSRSTTRANLDIGAIVAGGETTLSLNYNSSEPMNHRQQFYQWRFVNNDHAVLRQVTAGKIYARSISDVFAPVLGLQFTNTPTTYKRSFGTYTLSNTTEPGWMVELYVNNVLVNYTKADASGFYTFEVPMVYGNSMVKLRFYGPWGEERTSEKYISIPFNFTPLHQLEYSLTAGVIDDELKGKYSRAVVNYGFSRHITVGGGMEYLSSVASGANMPFLNVSARVGPNILVSAEHAYGVRTKSVLNYRLPSSLQVELNYTRYNPKQTAIRTNYDDERKITLSMPLRGKHFTAFSRFTLNQFTLPYNKLVNAKPKQTSAEFLLSTVVSGISSNLTTYAIFNNPGNPLVYSNLSLSFRFPGGIRFTPQAQYEYRQKQFSTVRAELEKSLFSRGFLNLAYEKILINNTSSITFGLRYNFSFAQTFFAANKSDQTISTIQSARGSLLHNGKTNYLGVSSQSSVGKGGIIILPFLDLNCNGKRDPNEPKAFGLKLRINGGRIEPTRDTTIRITGLEAYTSYHISLEESSFDNIAWQIRKRTLSVAIDANKLKLIEVPVAVVGEVSGSVLFQDSKGSTALGRIIVNIHNLHGVQVARMLTETDGFFEFIGLAPGDYIASIDAGQLGKLNMTSSPVLPFRIVQNIDGDIVNGLEFTLRMAPGTKTP